MYPEEDSHLYLKYKRSCSVSSSSSGNSAGTFQTLQSATEVLQFARRPTMSSQAAALTHIAAAVNSTIYATQITKSVKSEVTDSLSANGVEFETLLEKNDPFSFVSESTVENLTTVFVSANSFLLQAIPALQYLRSSPLVVHAQIIDDDFAIVSALKDSGFTILISSNAKESQDLALAAYYIAQKSNKGVLHFYSDVVSSSVKLLSNVEKISQSISSLEKDTESNQNIVSDAFQFVKSVSGNSYTEFEYKGPRKPTVVFTILGNAAAELYKPAYSSNVGIITILVYRPLNIDAFVAQLPSSTESLLLLEQSSFVAGTQFQSLLLDFFNDLDVLLKAGIQKVIASQLLSINLSNATSIVNTLVSNASLPKPVQNLTLGSEFTDSLSTTKAAPSQEAVAKARKLEDAYIKILDQVFGSKLNIINQFDSESLEKSNPEFGYGKFIFEEEKKNELIYLVHDIISSHDFKTPQSSQLIDLLTKWQVSARSSTSNDSDIETIISLLTQETESQSAKDLLAYKEYLPLKSSWLIGSDAWSYDLGSSGVHHVIASGKNVNMLIIDSEPHDSLRQRNNIRKKDVGLYAMNFGGAYVASVAVYASYTQVLQAFIEAGKFDGPSIVLGYLPYHSEEDDALNVLKETKNAVDSGYWPLYRFDPVAEERGDMEEAFKLDSASIKRELQDFLDRENKLTLLAKKNPTFARNLASSDSSNVRELQSKKAKEAYNKLLESLTGAPLTIAFASDGGNAENLAKKLARRGASRGLKISISSMDDLSLEDFALEENVVFFTSTSGQGEFPQNGKQFWDAIKNAADLDLTTVKVSCFGLGDSEYWPRKEDKHYYNKPAKDLFARLKFLGAQELVPLGLGDDQDADGFNTGYNEWEPKVWEVLGVAGGSNADEPPPITNEDMKAASDFLRGTIAEGLQDLSTGAISASDQQMTKFHGIYMQDDRDIRDQRKAEGMEPAYAFMARVRLPGGNATPKQWLKIDELADVRGNGTLKITTRATFQLHGLVKHNLKAAIRGMNSVLMDTLGACGDVNRNVMVSALPGNAKVHDQIAKSSWVISEHLLPQTTAYHEIWLEGADENDSSPKDPLVWENRKEGPKKQKTLVAGNALVDVEPFYGPLYLPRKFKVVITVPPYNDVDVYAHDVGLIAIVDENDIVTGYNVLAGGGMGTTHNNKKTYPRTGSMMGYVKYDEVHTVCEKIMIVQRDNGDRSNRKHARLKYTIDDMGVDVFRSEVEKLWGKKFEEPREFEIKSNIDYFGWVTDETGLHHYTCFIENGRVEDTPERPHKTGLKAIAKYMDETAGEFRLTGNQHLLISNIRDSELDTIKELLAQYKLDNTNYSALRLSSAACVAFPTCGLAMAESERYLPVLISKLELALEEYGLRHDSVVMRMTGCPNGCARPWLAEVALVGKAYGAYNLMLGGGYHGQRLNKLYRQSIKEDEVLAILKPLFKGWSLERLEGEHFGDYLIRTGVIAPTTEGKYFHDNVPEDA